jgi:hypothetical protein
MKEEGGANKKIFDLLTLEQTLGPNMDRWCIEVVLESCEFFFLSKLLYIIFLTNLEHSVLSLGSIFK